MGRAEARECRSANDAVRRPPQPMPEQPIILFDGVCNLCTRSVRFIIRRDPRARFRFAALDSPAAVGLAKAAGGPVHTDTIALVEGGRIFTRSTAALRIARGLRWPWPLLYGFIAVPRPLRDWVYRIVARNRYRWFGRGDACMVPTPDLRDRFLG